MLAVVDKANNISKNDFKLRLDEYKELNILVDDLINIILVLMYGKNRANNEISNISTDKENDVNGYVNKYINIVNDKISFFNDVSELIDELLGTIDKNTSNDIALKKLKIFKNYMLKLINNFNSYIKTDTKITPKQIVKIIPKRKILKIILKLMLKIILKIKLKITANQILKITLNQILKMTSNGILMILGNL